MRVCRVLLFVFAAAYLFALALLAIGTFGLFGQERDPLSGVFVVLLGQPWAGLAGGAPEALLPWIAVAAPLVNLLILAGLCRLLTARGA